MLGVTGDRAKVRYTGRYDNISFSIKTTFLSFTQSRDDTPAPVRSF